MFKKHRIEIITFAVALTASVALFLWMEYEKPDHGILSGAAREPGIRHKDTGELLFSGRNRAHAALRFAHQLRQQRIRNNKADAAEGPQGVDRFSETLTGANLRNTTLANADLSGVIIRGADLRGIDLRASLVVKADFEGSDLTKADLSLANLSQSNLSRTNLRGAQLVAATARGALFREADLSGANLFNGDFRSADFSGANLAGVRTEGRARLAGAILTGALNVPDDFRALVEADDPADAVTGAETPGADSAK